MYPIGSGAPKARPILGNWIEFGQVKHQRTRVTTAQVNAGFTLLPALPGVKWRIVDCDMVAIGGNAATATSVDLLGTKAGSASRPVVNAIAGLTQSARLRMGAANSVILADGASFTAHDANTAISVTKQSGGSNLATATHIDVLLTYVADPA
jgi:hypothetical protein